MKLHILFRAKLRRDKIIHCCQATCHISKCLVIYIIDSTHSNMGTKDFYQNGRVGLSGWKLDARDIPIIPDYTHGFVLSLS